MPQRPLESSAWTQFFHWYVGFELSLKRNCMLSWWTENYEQSWQSKRHWQTPDLGVGGPCWLCLVMLPQVGRSV